MKRVLMTASATAALLATPVVAFASQAGCQAIDRCTTFLCVLLSVASCYAAHIVVVIKAVAS